MKEVEEGASGRGNGICGGDRGALQERGRRVRQEL